MTLYALLFTIASIGISETAYLIKSRKKNEHPVCLIGGDCEVVLDSKYNRIFGVHNDLLGFLFYVFITIILGLIVVEVEPLEIWTLLAKISIYSAAAFSLYLVYLQKFVIKKWCFWCLMSAFTVWLMTLLILLIN